MDDATYNTVVGEIKIVSADERETLLDIARSHGFGYQDMKLSNAEVDTWLPGDGQQVLIPAKFILPVAPTTTATEIEAFISSKNPIAIKYNSTIQGIEPARKGHKWRRFITGLGTDQGFRLPQLGFSGILQSLNSNNKLMKN